MEDTIRKINKSVGKLLETQTLQKLCTLILKEVLELTKLESGSIFLVEEDKLEKINSIQQGSMVKIGKNDNIYKILVKGKAVQYPKNKWGRFDCLHNIQAQTVIFLPIAHQRELVGLIIAFSNQKKTLTKKELSLLELFASSACLAIKKTQMHAQVQNALEMRDRFISLASHELRTPLTSLNGYVQLLYRNIDKQINPASRWIKELYEESSRLTHLIKELLDINRIKQGQLEFILHEVDMVGIVKTAKERFHFVHKERELHFTNKLKNGRGKIIGDTHKLLQMISSLLNNAVKFSPPDSEIQISLEEQDRHLSLQIKDEGTGIPAKEIKKIFNGFYKIGKEEKEGMGVGLLLSEHIIKSHHGKIEIRPNEKKGTIIEVQLPSLKM